jgi:hypothetical protein
MKLLGAAYKEEKEGLALSVDAVADALKSIHL